MSLSPEIRKIPEIIGKFNRAGLTGELMGALIKGKTGRDLVVDATRLLVEYGGNEWVDVRGIGNIPKDSGCLVVFNHPNMDVLLPAMLTLMVKVHDEGGQVPMLLMGAEIPLFGKFNETYPLPGSIDLIGRFHRLYPENIISVPMSTARKDYNSGRFLATRKAVAALQKGRMVMIAPEGHVEMANTISPVDTLHSGAGGLSRIAANAGVPTVPVGIWEIQKDGSIHINIGVPFLVSTNDNAKAGSELMFRVAHLMPKHLWGPFM
jgi:hypothetical protein